GVTDVFEPQDFTLRIGSENDVPILLFCVKAPLIGQDVLFRLRLDPRGLTESPGRAYHALFRHGLRDVFGRYVVGAHPVGIQPDPHRVRTVAEVHGAPHALDALDPRHDLDVGEVVKEFLIDVWIRAVDVQLHQHTWHDLAD